MRPIASSLLVSIVLLSACRPDTPATTTAPTPEPVPTTTSIPPEPVALAHSLVPGDILAYDLELHRSVSLRTDGDPEAPLDDLPASIDLGLTAGGRVVMEVGEESGGEMVVGVVGSLEEVSFEGTADGEPIDDPADLDPLGEVLALPSRIGVASTGRLSRPQIAEVPAVVPDPLSVWTGFLGPVLPAAGAVEGGAWAGDLEQGGEVSGRLTAPEDGALVMLAGRTSSPATDVDMSDFYRGFLSAFGGTEAAARLVFRLDPREEEWEAVFDTGAGRLMESSARTTTVNRIEGAAPDRVTGEETEFVVRVEVGDELESRLVDPSES